MQNYYHSAKTMHCLIVDDHPVTLLGLILIVKNHFPDWQISTVNSAREAISLQDTISHLPPEVYDPIGMVILDLAMDNQDGIAVLEYFQKSGCAVHCLVVSEVEDPNTIAICKSLGAKGCISKYALPTDVAKAIRSVCVGDTYFVDWNVSSCVEINESAKVIKLTDRQREVVDLVLAGYSNKKIANTLNISYGTVKNYMFDLMRLASANSRLELAMKMRKVSICPCQGTEFADGVGPRCRLSAESGT